MCLRNPLTSAVTPRRFAEHSLNTTGLEDGKTGTAQALYISLNTEGGQSLSPVLFQPVTYA
jgi:hypothetical protein